MPAIGSCPTERYKTALAYEEGNIQANAERQLEEDPHPLINIIPATGRFDPNSGYSPRYLRWAFAPSAETPYVNILNERGNSAHDVGTTGCDNDKTQIEGLFNDVGSPLCDLPGESLHGGYDEFGREVKARAMETEPICIPDLVLKDRIGPYVNSLREELPKQMVRHFGYQLERDVIGHAAYNTAIGASESYGRGYFPGKPTSGLSIGYLKRLRARMIHEGWTGRFTIYGFSMESINQAIENYKRSKSVDYAHEIKVMATTDERLVRAGVMEVQFEDLYFIITPMPTRGFVRRVGQDALGRPAYEFVRVPAYITRAGTGAGVVPEPNQDYHNCVTRCDGQDEQLFELGYIVHPDFAKRMTFALPQIADKRFSDRMFNFEVTMLDDWAIDCNKDKFKVAWRSLHAYEFQVKNPELAGGILALASPDCIDTWEPCCQKPCPDPTETITMREPNAVDHDECSGRNCDTISTNGQMLVEDCEPVAKGNGPGQIDFVDLEIDIACDQCVAKICATRSADCAGAVTADVVLTDGSAVVGTDYTAPASVTLSWDDGEFGEKCLDVDITSIQEVDSQFTFALGNATGGVTLSAETGTVTLAAQDETLATRNCS